MIGYNLQLVAKFLYLDIAVLITQPYINSLWLSLIYTFSSLLFSFSKFPTKFSSPISPQFFPNSHFDAVAAGNIGMKHYCMMKSLMFRCFSLRSIIFLVFLTMLLVVLPLLLPPLPPPPSALMFVPVLIMSFLVLLAFSSSQIPHSALSST